MDTDQFYAGFADRPFDSYGLQNIFIAPGGAARVDDQRGFVPLYELAPATVKALLTARKAIVLDVSNGHFVDVTGEFSSAAPYK
jgi:hypothetical protein